MKKTYIHVSRLEINIRFASIVKSFSRAYGMGYAAGDLKDIKQRKKFVRDAKRQI